MVVTSKHILMNRIQQGTKRFYAGHKPSPIFSIWAHRELYSKKQITRGKAVTKDNRVIQMYVYVMRQSLILARTIPSKNMCYSNEFDDKLLFGSWTQVVKYN